MNANLTYYKSLSLIRKYWNVKRQFCPFIFKCFELISNGLFLLKKMVRI